MQKEYKQYARPEISVEARVDFKTLDDVNVQTAPGVNEAIRTFQSGIAPALCPIFQSIMQRFGIQEGATKHEMAQVKLAIAQEAKQPGADANQVAWLEALTRHENFKNLNAVMSEPGVDQMLHMLVVMQKLALQTKPKAKRALTLALALATQGNTLKLPVTLFPVNLFVLQSGLEQKDADGDAVFQKGAQRIQCIQTTSQDNGVSITLQKEHALVDSAQPKSNFMTRLSARFGYSAKHKQTVKISYVWSDNDLRMHAKIGFTPLPTSCTYRPDRIKALLAMCGWQFSASPAKTDQKLPIRSASMHHGPNQPAPLPPASTSISESTSPSESISDDEKIGRTP